MRSALHLKFFIVYIAFGFLILFSVSAIAPQMLSYRLEKTTAERLYTDASTLSSEYLPQYFSEDISFPDVHMQLEGMQKYTTANLWFVEADGTLITSSTLSGSLWLQIKLIILIRPKTEVILIRLVTTTIILMKI